MNKSMSTDSDVPSSRHRLASCSALLLGGLLALSAGASEDPGAFAEMSLRDLMELEVFTSASLLPTPLAKAPGTVYSFRRDDFLRLGVRRLDELLQFVPGFQLNQYRKRHNSIWARGTLNRYNDKLVLLVDGIPMRHQYYGHFSLGENLPLEKLEKVEIISGPASSLYGANAFAGIISVTTRDFAETPRLEATAEVGNHSRVKGTLMGGNDRVQVFASYLDQDAPFADDRKSFIGGDTLQPLDENYSDIMIKVRPFDGLTLSLDYQQNDTPFLFIPNTQDAFVEERPLTLAAQYQHGDLATGKLEAKAYWMRDDALEYEIETESRALGYRERQNAVRAGASLTSFRRLFDSHTLAFGGSWEYAKAKEMDSVRYWHYRDGFLDPPQGGPLLSDPGLENNDFALFVQDVWDLSQELTLTFGGRYDNYEVFDDYFNYRAALVYTPDRQQTLKLMYGTAIRTPNYREYLKVLEGTDFQAPVADPERIRSLELGYTYQWESANLSATLFRNRFDDYIHEVPTPDGEDEYFANSDQPWNIKGLELLANLQPTAALHMQLGAAYIRAESDELGRLPYIADWSGSFNLDYRYRGGHHAGFSVIYNSDREDTNSYSRDDSDAFWTLNLHGHGALSKDLSYAFGVNNLLDRKIYDPAADFGGQYNTERSERELWVRLQLATDL